MTVTVVIPTLNEDGNVGRLIHETFRVVPRYMTDACKSECGAFRGRRRPQ